MNYLKQLNAFYDLIQAVSPLNANSQALYLFLLHINNRCNWSRTFTVANQTIELFTGLNKQQIQRARNNLIQQKYIRFEKGKNKNLCGKYEIKKLYDEDENEIQCITSDTVTDTLTNTVTDTLTNTVTDTLTNTVTDTINKHKHKQKLKLNNIESIERKKFKAPTVEEVQAYCKERNNDINAEQFIDFYSSKGWRVGNQPMKDWKACVRTWERRSFSNNKKQKNSLGNEREYSDKEFDDTYDDLQNYI